MNPTPPQNDDAERARALEQAMAARETRAELKRALADGNLDFDGLLEQGHYGSGDTAAGRIEIGDALIAIDGIGPKKAAAILAEAGIDDDTIHLNALTREQVDALSEALFA